MNYYNEFDPHAAQWLKNLIAGGMIPAGIVDTRSITEVIADDLRGFTQCHFFAGIGGWSFALALAGWPENEPVWTGSCPCQPFSVAGKGLGTKDERHLWPHFRRLIADGKPSVCFGEQVASKAGREWFSGVRADLEALGYCSGGADLCAAGVGSPQLRQRLYWVADSEHDGCNRSGGLATKQDSNRENRGIHCGSASRTASGSEHSFGWLEHSTSDRREPRGTESDRRSADTGCFPSGWLGDPNQPGSQGWPTVSECYGKWSPWKASLDNWIPCGDGKARRIEPGLAPLVNGVSGRVGLIRGYGNAIVPQAAAEFIKAYKEAIA